MKITADNRGRIALGKLDKLTHYKMGVADLAGSEWDVQLKDAHLVVKPWKETGTDEEPPAKWVRVVNFSPEHVGQVVGVENGSGVGEIKTYGDWGKYGPPGVFGKLVAYSTDAQGDVTDLRLEGVEDILKPAPVGRYRLERFYVRNS